MDAMCRHEAGPQKAVDTAVKESKEDDNGKGKKYLWRAIFKKDEEKKHSFPHNHRILCSTKVDRVYDDSILAVITIPSISSPLTLLCVVMKHISKLAAASYPAPGAR